VVKKEPETAIVNVKIQKRSRGDIEEENKDKVWSRLLFVNKVIIAKPFNRLSVLLPMTTRSLR